VAKLDIYLSDDLKQRARAAGISWSPLCQPVIGYAVLHGQAAAEAALRNLGTAADVQDNGQLDRIEKLVTDLHEREPEPEPEQLLQHQDDRASWTTADWIRADWTKAVAAFATAWLLCIYLPA
jgi:hypothetical protein